MLRNYLRSVSKNLPRRGTSSDAGAAEAWSAVYAYASEAQAEARGAVAKFEALHATVPNEWKGASSRTFFFAGRCAIARRSSNVCNAPAPTSFS